VRKNVAGQVIAAAMVSVDDGSAFTGTVTVYITGDGGAQAIGTVGSGVCTHEGNGLHTYQPSQAETNYTHLAFTFVGSGAVPVTIQVYTNVDQQLVDIQSRIPLTLDNGNMRSSVQSMATNVLTASALASDAVAEIQSGLALESTLTVIAGYLDTEIAAIKAKTDNLPSDPASASTLAASFVTVNTKLDAIDDYVDSEVAAIKTVTDRINGMLVLDGSVYQYTANALELGPSGSTSVSVYPTQLQAEDRNVEGPIKIYTGEYGEQYFHALDANLDPIDLTGITLELRFGDSIQKNILYTAKTSDNTIVVSNTNKVTFTKSLNFTRFEMSTLRFALRDMDEGAKVLLTGPVKLSWAP